jgi:hypothetical protein
MKEIGGSQLYLGEVFAPGFDIHQLGYLKQVAGPLLSFPLPHNSFYNTVKRVPLSDKWIISILLVNGQF